MSERTNTPEANKTPLQKDFETFVEKCLDREDAETTLYPDSQRRAQRYDLKVASQLIPIDGMVIVSNQERDDAAYGPALRSKYMELWDGAECRGAIVLNEAQGHQAPTWKVHGFNVSNKEGFIQSVLEIVKILDNTGHMVPVASKQ
jgi:hypothetical protein